MSVALETQAALSGPVLKRCVVLLSKRHPATIPAGDALHVIFAVDEVITLPFMQMLVFRVIVPSGIGIDASYITNCLCIGLHASACAGAAKSKLVAAKPKTAAVASPSRRKPLSR
ncbi:hypothetical protein ACPPVW_17035 [Leifsonia sp. McL0607]|uniref:hypothetical protein n=1 Tax=Leifsonia sp. McL0607 TaxID=3415672 RepID=UPI003CFA4F80